MWRCIPRAPASSNASACVKPSPRAAPDTSTTFPARLNSGSPWVAGMVWIIEYQRCTKRDETGLKIKVCVNNVARGRVFIQKKKCEIGSSIPRKPGPLWTFKPAPGGTLVTGLSWYRSGLGLSSSTACMDDCGRPRCSVCGEASRHLLWIA